MPDLTKEMKMTAVNLANGSIAAFSEGRTVQFRVNDHHPWIDAGTGDPAFGIYEFRVKPEPIVRWFPMFKDGSVCFTDAYLSKSACVDFCCGLENFLRAVRFVQQDEEPKR